jgi:uncharacterized protein
MQTTLFIVALLALVAFLYASVGHGGASGYIAILSLFGFGQAIIRPSSLILNIVVSGISFYQFYRHGYFRWRLFWPFALLSIPLAYWGGLHKLSEHLYQQLLGICLIFPILRLLGWGQASNQVKEIHLPSALVIGAIIGLLSGMLGIGGGILLTPLLIILAWAGMKEAAAVSALFIFVNSVSGLIAQLQNGMQIPTQTYYWLLGAVLGGLLGAYYGSKYFVPQVLKYLLAVVLVIACAKLLFT